MPYKPAAVVTIAEKLATGSLLHIRKEFAPWIGMSVATAYAHVKAGRLRTTKIGHRTYVSAADAFAFRDLVVASQPDEAA